MNNGINNTDKSDISHFPYYIQPKQKKHSIYDQMSLGFRFSFFGAQKLHYPSFQ